MLNTEQYDAGQDESKNPSEKVEVDTDLDVRSP
jgi:hypothetical protein